MTEQTAENVVGTRPSLAGKFTPDRGAAVAGLLTRRPTPAPVDASPVLEAAVEPVAESDGAVSVLGESAPPVETPARKPASPVRKPGAAKSSTSVSRVGVKQVGAYLEPDVFKLAGEDVRANGGTFDALLVRSFEKVTDDTLRELWAPTGSSTTMPTREVRKRGTAGIQRQFQLSETQTEWLDRKIEAVGAPSRSALIAAVLRLSLRKS